MSILSLPVQVPYRMRIADQKQMDSYNTQIADYTSAIDRYKQQLEAYNRLVDEYNAGGREKEFTGVQPTEPTAPGFTQAQLDAFQADAQRRGQTKQTQLTRGINLIRNPGAFENINLAGMSFAQGGVVPPVMSGIGTLGLPGIFL